MPTSLLAQEYWQGESLYHLDRLNEALAAYRKVVDVSRMHEYAPMEPLFHRHDRDA